MKILLISNRVMHYRVPVYNYLSRRFREHGCEFVVRSDQLQPQNPYRLDFDFKELPLRFGDYRTEIDAVNPDVVVLFLRLKDLVVWPLAHWLKARDTPVAFWMKAMNYDRPRDIRSRLLYQYMHTLVDGLILYASQEMTRIARWNRHKAFAAPNAIAPSSCGPVAQSKNDIKKELGIPFTKVVLAVGRMDVERGRKKLDHLVDVFREIDTPGVGLVIVGSGVSRKLQDTFNDKNTLYLGEVHDSQGLQISKLFKMADVFCLPGHVGLALNQAFMFGLPVVTEAGNQPPEINYLIDGRNGFIVPKDDRAALKKRIVELLDDDRKRNEFAACAQADIARNGSVEGMFQGFWACVTALASDRSPRTRFGHTPLSQPPSIQRRR